MLRFISNFFVCISLLIVLAGCAVPREVSSSVNAVEYPDWIPVFKSDVEYLPETRIVLQQDNDMTCNMATTTESKKNGKKGKFKFSSLISTRGSGDVVSAKLDYWEREKHLAFSATVNQHGLISTIETAPDNDQLGSLESSKFQEESAIKRLFHHFSLVGKKLATGTSVDKRSLIEIYSPLITQGKMKGNLLNVAKQKSLVVGKAILYERSVIVIRFAIAFELRIGSTTLDAMLAGNEWVDEQTGLISGYSRIMRITDGKDNTFVSTDSANCSFAS
jgi:hypothetical protein